MMNPNAMGQNLEAIGGGLNPPVDKIPALNDNDVTRVYAPASAFFQVAGVTSPQQTRRFYYEMVLTAPAYGLAIGPLSTFDELLVDNVGNIDVSQLQNGPAHYNAPPIVVTSKRPFVGYLKPGRYVVYVRNPPNTGGNLWWKNQPIGDTWVSSGGDGLSGLMTVSGTVPKPVMYLDLLAFHDPYWKSTLPNRRADYRVNASYNKSANIAGMDTAVWTDGTTFRFAVHAEGRKSFRFGMSSTDAAGETWECVITGAYFANSGVEPFTIGGTVILTVPATANIAVDFMRIPNSYDGYLIDVTRHDGGAGSGLMNMVAIVADD